MFSKFINVLWLHWLKMLPYQFTFASTLSWQAGAIGWPLLTKTASVLHRRTFKALLDDDNSYLYIKGPQTLELAAHAF